MSDPAESPLLLIVNPSAGGGRARRVLDRATTILDRVRKPFRVEFSTSGEHAGELASLGIDLGETPVAVGGDGQVARIAHPLVGTDRVMGILPTGRGNDLARGLGIPTRPDDAVRTLLGGVPKTNRCRAFRRTQIPGDRLGGVRLPGQRDRQPK